MTEEVQNIVQREGGTFTGAGQTSALVQGRSVVAQVMKEGNFTATVELQARSVYAGTLSDTYWAPVASLTTPGIHIYSAPLDMEWRLEVTNFTSGTIYYVLESSMRTDYAR